MTRQPWWRGARTRRGPLALLCGALLLGGALAGCAPNSGIGGGAAVASVNGHTISLSDYEQMLTVYETGQIQQTGGQGVSFAWQSPDGRTSANGIKQATMEFLVTLELAHEHLTKPINQKDLQSAKSALDKERQQVLSQAASAPGAKQFADALTPDMVNLLAEQEVIFNEVSTEPIFPTAHMRVILVKTQSQAENLEKQAEHGADFGQLAHTNNLDQSLAANNGDLPQSTYFVGELGSGSTLAQSIDQAVFAPGKQNVKYAIVNVQGEYALIEVTQRANKPLSTMSDASTEQSAFQSWIDDVVRPAAQVNEYIALS